jgi:Zn finger protein HypA/HybF involved in hydrogenase expression
MHELSLVAELIEEVEQRAAGRGVALVVVRHATTISEETVRHAFAMLTADGPLFGAKVECQPFDITLQCAACGFDGTLDHDHLVGHLRICPMCAEISGDSQLPEMELVSVVLEDSVPRGS